MHIKYCKLLNTRLKSALELLLNKMLGMVFFKVIVCVVLKFDMHIKHDDLIESGEGGHHLCCVFILTTIN